jgi:hypothetical protein
MHRRISAGSFKGDIDLANAGCDLGIQSLWRRTGLGIWHCWRYNYPSNPNDVKVDKDPGRDGLWHHKFTADKTPGAFVAAAVQVILGSYFHLSPYRGRRSL